MLVSFFALTDPAATVAVQDGLVTALEAVPPALLPAGVPAGTRIHLAGGEAFDVPPYQDVVGTVAATIAALGGLPPVPSVFGTDFLQSAGSDGQTSSGVFVPIPGTQRTVPFTGSVFLSWSLRLGTTGINDGLAFVVFKNGAPLPSVPLSSFVGLLVAGSGFAGLTLGKPILNASGVWTDACVAGDVYELAALADPGGGVAQWYAPVLATWRAT